MNYCPECGGAVDLEDETEDVATSHLKYKCSECGKRWEETVSSSIMRETLHISPIVD